MNRFHHHHPNVFFSSGCFNGFNCNPFFFGSGFGFGFGFGAAYPYYYAPYYPLDYYSAPSTYYPDQYYTMNAPQSYQQENTNDVYLATMLQHLTDEVESLKTEQARQAAGAPSKTETSATAITFVFRDGRLITTHNYAVAGQTLWIFTETSARKYQLSELDRAATERTNAANGIEIHLPESR